MRNKWPIPFVSWSTKRKKEAERALTQQPAANGRRGRGWQAFRLVEHPMKPRALAPPMHRHHREDEYSFVLEGSIGALLGDAVVIGHPGDLIFKPREQWHTFWNAGDSPARILEIITPAGFENYFRELGAELLSGAPDPSKLAALCASYELDMDMSSVPSLIQRFGVRFPGAPQAGAH